MNLVIKVWMASDLDEELDNAAAALCRIFAKNMLFIIKFDK